MPYTAIQPAQLTFSPEGTPISTLFSDIYYSADGGPGQAQHVFVQGNNLAERWARRRNFTVLENGFGAGLNFLTTWAAWHNDPQRPDKLHYLATDLHPLPEQDLALLHAPWPELELFAAALRSAWPLLVAGFHRLEFADGHVVLTLMLGDSEKNLRKLNAHVDAFYLDGFDPNKNPQMWSASLLHRCEQLAAADATFATWCVAGQVRKALNEAGFITEKRPGFGRKREMLVGKVAERRNLPRPAPPPQDRHVVIIGAGLAGCASAERLAARGWQVDLFDRHAAPAEEASGNLAGIVRPLLTRDDSHAARLSRACFLYLLRQWQGLNQKLNQTDVSPRGKLNGFFQLAHGASEAAHQREWLAESGLPSQYVQFIEQSIASQYLGANTPQGGYWFPSGGWINPPSLCQAWLKAGGHNIRFHANSEISHLQYHADQWQLLDVNQQCLARASHVIFATGAQGFQPTTAHNATHIATHNATHIATKLTSISEILAGLPIQPVRGQVSHIAAGKLPALKHAISGDGYLTPAVDGLHCLGASYIKDASQDAQTTLSYHEHAENLQRLSRMLLDSALNSTLPPAELAGRVGLRATTPDHLPLVGALPNLKADFTQDTRLKDFPRQTGLYGLLGAGSRGLVWTALLAEQLASLINAEPLPLEKDLSDAVDPARFALRQCARASRTNKHTNN